MKDEPLTHGSADTPPDEINYHPLEVALHRDPRPAVRRLREMELLHYREQHDIHAVWCTDVVDAILKVPRCRRTRWLNHVGRVGRVTA